MQKNLPLVTQKRDSTPQEIKQVGIIMIRSLLCHLHALPFCIASVLMTSPQLVASQESKLLPLRTDGIRIVNENNEPVLLRGVNLGGWLVEEIWMLPFDNTPPEGSDFVEVTCHTTLWNTLEKRFGKDGVLKIRQAWRENWLTKEDFARIKAAGLNCVRLPVLYDLLETPEGLFPWVDKALEWAGAHGIYVILDLHGAPGRQSPEHHTGHKDVNQLFKDPENVEKTVEVWKILAERYKNHPGIAAFDLLNEPTGAPNESTMYLVYDRLYREVRAVAPSKILIIDDAFRGIRGMPIPKVVGWENILLSQHEYLFDATSGQSHIDNLENIIKKIDEARKIRNAPVYIGEFNIEPYSSPEIMRKFMDTFDENEISWTFWTYKTAMRGGGGGMWGWFRAPSTIETIDTYEDSLEEILRKIKAVQTPKMEVSGLAEALGSGH